MQNIQSKEKILLKVRGGSLGLFYFLLVAGVAMIGIGAARGQIQYLVDGAIFLVTSPIFLAMTMIAKQKLKELGI